LAGGLVPGRSSSILRTVRTGAARKVLVLAVLLEAERGGRQQNDMADFAGRTAGVLRAAGGGVDRPFTPPAHGSGSVTGITSICWP